ncbi:MAG: ABC transporter ATP-binding protein/permease [Anaerolineae bacterium]|nr:ABC transporter ATP-binding protein/permease [Anaerolineae bacterium]
MGFIMNGLDTEAYDRTYSDKELLRRIVGYFRPYTAQMVVIAVAITLSAAAGTGSPILIARALDILVQSPTTGAMALLAGGVFLLGAAAWGFNFIQQRLVARVVGSVVLKLRQDVFGATIEHDLSFFDEHPSGKMVSRITSDTQDFSEVVTLSTNLMSQVLLVLLLAGWLLTINVWLTLVLLAFAPVAVALALSFRRIARRVTLDARRVTATINAQIQESISGIMVAKSFRQEQAIYTTFSDNNEQGYRAGLRRGLTLNTIFPIVGASSGIGVGLLIYAGGLTSRSGLVSPGEWYLFMQSVGFFWFPLLGIASFWSQFQDGLSAAERVFALIDAEPKVVQTSPPIPLPLDGKDLAGEVEFRHVHFSYNLNEIVLPDFSLTIAPQETIALVGHTGAGKSSIIKLLTRFYEFQSGQILLDGRDIRRLDLRQYRRHIGLVTQTPFLFSTSVAENIRYGRPGASDDEVRQAALGISGGDWLGDLPHGLETDVGERGANLSLGQRQLVALARVLLKNPAIFILDEATASVDPFTEAQIQEGLEAVMRDRTAIVIAHRLSTVKNADRIIVMDHGQIVEEGNHTGLMAQGGHYAELYNTYFRHQSLDYKIPDLEEELT